ncbi:hypothetical protein FACS1894191_4530 [Clostridia bacterium]|nr:hypothetical protein FACS1894191_4530 [Clostridia bacterium]
MDLDALIGSVNFAHSKKVSEISGILAKHAGYSVEETDLIRQAALFHDLGKADVPKEILNKPGALTEQEFNIIKTHTQLGSRRIEETLRVLSAACVIAREHHEKWSGQNGYIGLAGENIHPYARLVACADVFDALISRRSYKAGWDKNEVCGYLSSQSGIQFDVRMIGLLLEHTDEIMTLYANS